MADIVDRQRFGRRLRAARIDAGYENMIDLARSIHDVTGLDLAPPTLYGYESGRTLPNLPSLLALVAVLRPSGGLEYFGVAVRPDIAELIWRS